MIELLWKGLLVGLFFATPLYLALIGMMIVAKKLLEGDKGDDKGDKK